MADQCHMKLMLSQGILCTPYSYALCHITFTIMQSHICRVHARLAVTCYLHIWQNDQDLLQAAGGGMDTKIRVSTKS